MNKIQKILVTILSFAYIIWFGGALLRSSMAYDLFVPGTKMVLKNWYPEQIQMHTVYLYSILSSYTNISYIIAFILGIVLFFQFKNKLRQKGWLFMIFIFFFLASPVELYKIFLDYKLTMAVYWNNVKDFADYYVQEYFVNRFSNGLLNTISGLSFLANITLIIFYVWQPLNKKEELDTIDE